MKRLIVATFAIFIFAITVLFVATPTVEAQVSVQTTVCRNYVGVHVHVPPQTVVVSRTNVVNGALQCFWRASGRNGSVTVAADNRVLGWTVFRDVSPEEQVRLVACRDYAASRIGAEKDQFSVIPGSGATGNTQAVWSAVGHKGTCSFNGQNKVVDFHQTQ